MARRYGAPRRGWFGLVGAAVNRHIGDGDVADGSASDADVGAGLRGDCAEAQCRACCCAVGVVHEGASEGAEVRYGGCACAGEIRHFVSGAGQTGDGCEFRIVSLDIRSDGDSEVRAGHAGVREVAQVGGLGELGAEGSRQRRCVVRVVVDGGGELVEGVEQIRRSVYEAGNGAVHIAFVGCVGADCRICEASDFLAVQRNGRGWRGHLIEAAGADLRVEVGDLGRGERRDVRCVEVRACGDETFGVDRYFGVGACADAGGGEGRGDRGVCCAVECRSSSGDVAGEADVAACGQCGGCRGVAVYRAGDCRCEGFDAANGLRAGFINECARAAEAQYTRSISDVNYTGRCV